MAPRRDDRSLALGIPRLSGPAGWASAPAERRSSVAHLWLGRPRAHWHRGPTVQPSASALLGGGTSDGCHRGAARVAPPRRRWDGRLPRSAETRAPLGRRRAVCALRAPAISNVRPHVRKAAPSETVTPMEWAARARDGVFAVGARGPDSAQDQTQTWSPFPAVESHHGVGTASKGIRGLRPVTELESELGPWAPGEATPRAAPGFPVQFDGAAMFHVEHRRVGPLGCVVGESQPFHVEHQGTRGQPEPRHPTGTSHQRTHGTVHGAPCSNSSRVLDPVGIARAPWASV